MFSRRSFCVLAVSAFTLVLPARFAAADDAPAKIATVNTAKVFNEMLETKDLKQKMDSDLKGIDDEKKRREADLQEADKRRKLFNEGTADFEKASQEFIEKSIAARTWLELIKLNLTRQQKSQYKSLFNKIEDATAEVAKAKNIDLVLVDQKLELPTDPSAMEQITVDQLRGMINQRTVIFNNGRLDITDAVIAAVDAKYKAKK
jgi:Skp family chaperone for outer membrane proteins